MLGGDHISRESAALLRSKVNMASRKSDGTGPPRKALADFSMLSLMGAEHFSP